LRPQLICSSPNGCRGGFTLLETALALIIVGVGVLAIVSAQQAFHRQNAWSTHAGIAAHLANEIREMTLNLTRHDPVTGATFWGPEPNEASLVDYDDLDDFDGNGNGTIFAAALENGPINAQRQVIANMPGWTQIVTVVNVQSSDINTVVADGTSNMMRMEVVITYQGPQDQQPIEMTRVSWISPK
jgi:Tfp pilus assembly protein PilV